MTGKQVFINTLPTPMQAAQLWDKISDLGLIAQHHSGVLLDKNGFLATLAAYGGAKIYLPGYPHYGDILSPSVEGLLSGRIWYPKTEPDTGKPIKPEFEDKMTQLMAYWKKISKKTPAQTA